MHSNGLIEWKNFIKNHEICIGNDQVLYTVFKPNASIKLFLFM